MSLVLMLSSLSVFADDSRCVGSRCITTQPSIDANYICRGTSYSGRGYAVSSRVGDRYICQDLGYSAYDRRFWAGHYTNQYAYVCCFDPYGY